MAEQSAFWNRLADRYAAQPVADEAAYRTKLARTRSHLAAGMELFEFGCGTGTTALHHAPHVRHIHAVDFSSRMVEIARAKAAAAGIGNVTFEVGDIATMAIPPARYDMVLGLSILHLLENKAAVIARVRDILKPGGLFVSSTTCLGDTAAFLRPVAPLGRALGLLPRLDFMTHAQLRDAIAAGGFAIEHDWRPNPRAAVFIIARKPPGPSAA
jgi:Methylase involved in ubiquinone/menaquinone biosynthesis